MHVISCIACVKKKDEGKLDDKEIFALQPYKNIPVLFLVRVYKEIEVSF